jgi:cystathionine beta-lyase
MLKPTQCVHFGAVHDTVTHGANSPIFTSTATGYLDSGGIVYPRYFNTPNQRAVVEKMAVLEHGEDGVIFGSGMAAISTTLFALLKSGDHAVFQRDLYGGTFRLVHTDLERFGIGFTLVDGAIAGDIERAVKPTTRMIYIETPSNPLLRIVDIRAVAALARSKGILTVIDNTFASPINQNPIDLGMDIVIHSGTKYLGGHSDLCCGALVSSKELTARVRAAATHFGGTLDPHTCYLLERSLKTLALRVSKQNENAMEVARYLAGHPKVKAVYYPGLENDPGHAVARGQMSGFGGMVAFEIRGNGAASEKFQRSLRLIKPAVSLGGIESIICSPARTSHAKLSERDRASIGIRDELLRLSVGIEAHQDLMADLEQAFGSV